MKKRVISLLLAYVMCFAVSSTAFASAAGADITNVPLSSNSEQMPIVVDYGTTSTTHKSESFHYYSLTHDMKFLVQVQVSSPTALILLLRDSNGKELGAATLNIPVTTLVTWNVAGDAFSIPAGDYTLEYWFTDSGITCMLLVYGVY